MTTQTKTTKRLTSSDITDMFLARKDEFGCASLTVKQVRWLLDQIGRESRSARSQRTYRVQTGTGQYYDLVVYPNGAGFLRPA